MNEIDPNTRKWLSWAIVVMLIVISTVMGVQFPIPQPPIESLGYTHFSGLVVTEPTTVTTATPGAVINGLGLGNILEVQDASTPMWKITNGGNVVAGGGETNNSWLKVAGPTAIATATPAAVVDSAGVSNILEVRDAATPVFTINNGGAVQQVGARTATGGDTINNWLIVSAPTAIATATPAAVVNSVGVSNIFEVRDASTPVVQIQNGGNLVASKLMYGQCTYSETSTAEQNLTPATNCYILAPANAISLTLQTTNMITGTVLTLANIANQTILVLDTNLRSHDGAQLSLGQYDVAELVYTGAEWYEMIELANQ